ncbi:MAG: Dabb family protein [Bacteroidota bacterium]
MKHFLHLALALPLFLVACEAPESTNETQLAHHVFIWLKNPDSEQDLEQLLAGMNTLKDIDVIHYFQVGIPANTEKRSVVDHSYSASLLLFFNNEADQLRYQQHAVHLAFVEKYSDLWQKVIVYDTKVL